jgi:ADP-ribosylglycohydrolase
MRVSPVGWAFDTLEDVLKEAKKSAAVTHNHPEGIKGAQAVALAIFLSRQHTGKEAIKKEIVDRFSYSLSLSLDEIRPGYSFDETCLGSVPQSIIAFLESSSFEDAVCKAISLGGDTDTMAAIAGSIAEAFYGGVPADIVTKVSKVLPQELKTVINQFRVQYHLPGENLL